MPDYYKPTGINGLMMIRDTGTYVEFWIKAGHYTSYNYNMPYGWDINGDVGSAQARYEPGGNWLKLKSWLVTTSQTVIFKLGSTGVGGLGGPQDFAQLISRTRTPLSPVSLAASAITSSSAYITFSDGDDNGLPITNRLIGYGTSVSYAQKTVYSDGSTVISGLLPGTTYYIWAKTYNAAGWGAYCAKIKIVTQKGSRLYYGGKLRDAVIYVKYNGVWRIAKPWVKKSGIWKEAL